MIDLKYLWIPESHFIGVQFIWNSISILICKCEVFMGNSRGLKSIYSLVTLTLQPFFK